ncbi:hypothetical protein [Streptomyces sp. CC228A]|uniref:hypothetical protein n=1 Tax=Streptomyces sp. CC228A TaxID=2898186 RepID=UPI001F3407D4|nr:hypothetical protein [Streptomyces sp. CC228A]
MTTDPSTAYSSAPSTISEISWVAGAAISRALYEEREFWLRKAALLDRIALQEVATYAPEGAAKAVDAANEAAQRFVRYDATRSGPGRRGLDLVTDADCRDYVREQYREWSLTRLR